MIKDISSILDTIPEKDNGLKLLLSEHLKIEQQYIKGYLEILIRVLKYKYKSQHAPDVYQMNDLMGILNRLIFGSSFDKLIERWNLIRKDFMKDIMFESVLDSNNLPSFHNLILNMTELIEIIEKEKWSI